MTIFIAGVHGVGKTYLAKPAAIRLGMTYGTASQLIREERGRATWDEAKKVGDVAQNQQALITAVRRVKAAGESLVLDGHFVLRTAVDAHQRLASSVFHDLGCTAVVLLTCPVAVIRARLSSRGDQSWSDDEIARFAHAEAEHAVSVSSTLAIPLAMLEAPSPEEFEETLARLSAKG